MFIIRLQNVHIKVYWTTDDCWTPNPDLAKQFETREAACQYAEKNLDLYHPVIIEELE